MTESVRVRGLEKRFGTLEVLRRIDFDVLPGESIALLGPSGCGKTTLLRILLGLDSADAGTFSRPLDRAGYLPQESVLFPWKRVMENIELPLQLQGIDRTARRAAIRKHLAMFGLVGFETAYPSELSGGMKQRVALLRAVMTGAKILVLDEPFGALDARTRHQLQRWLADVVDRLKMTLLFITHDLDEALVLAHRILVLSDRPATVLGDIRAATLPEGRLKRESPRYHAVRDELIRLISTKEGPR